MVNDYTLKTETLPGKGMFISLSDVAFESYTFRLNTRYISFSFWPLFIFFR